MPSSNPHARAQNRMLSVEILRVVSMLGIAVFHTFQPFFESLVAGTLADAATTELLVSHPATLATLGFIDQLGAWGNHVFIMISGCFLLPQALEVFSDERRASQRKKTIRRVKTILLTVAVYVPFALLAGARWPDVTSASLTSTTWLTQGLQFIWVYLVLVMLCPFIGRAWRRCSRPSVVLAIAVVLVYGTNLYIAFVSPGNDKRSLLEWRKLMSAVTYALSFVIGGWIALQQRKNPSKRDCLPTVAVIVSLAVTIAAEIYAARRGDLALFGKLSFKSTSPLACAMAASAVAFAHALPPSISAKSQRLARVVAFATSGMLGFYVLQSLFSKGWHQISNALLAQTIQMGDPVFLLSGVAFSVALFITFILIDALIRQPLLAQSNA